MNDRERSKSVLLLYQYFKGSIFTAHEVFHSHFINDCLLFTICVCTIDDKILHEDLF